MDKKSIVSGKVCLTPRGTYDSQAEYEQLDIIQWNGSSWLALQEFSGIEPVAGNGYVMLLGPLKGNPGSGLTLATSHNIGDLYRELLDTEEEKISIPAERFMQLYEAADCECRLIEDGCSLVLYPTMFFKNFERGTQQIRVSTTAGLEYADFHFIYTPGASHAEVTLDISETVAPYSVHLAMM